MYRIGLAAIGLAALLAAPAGVTAQSSSEKPPVTTREPRKLDARGEGRRLFHGIELTDAERTQLKAVRQKYDAERKVIHDRLRPAFEEARAARERGDTVAARAALSKSEADRTALKALREREVADLRAALTPEHQAQFDANVASLKDKAKHGRRGRKGLKG